MKAYVAAAAVLALLAMAAPEARAMGADPMPAPNAADTAKDYAAGVAAIQAALYDKGIELMKKVVALEPKNADAYNYLGFAYRKTGNVKLASASYDTALMLNANHKGALEYQGELFLKLNRVEDAMKNRARLQALCPIGCTELRELDRAIADHKAAGGQST